MSTERGQAQASKLDANRARDLDTNAHLAANDWRVMRIWEHVALDDAVAAVQAALREVRSEIRASSVTEV